MGYFLREEKIQEFLRLVNEEMLKVQGIQE